MNDKIKTRLAELEDEHRFRIVYACESGSRAWGFASADSDYDVRFIFAWPRDRYLAVASPPETYDFGVDEELIDLSGWDIRKALRLFGKSNGAMVEWLYSPIVYREDADLVGTWRGLTGEVFCPKANAAHYRGLAKSIWKGMAESGVVTAKAYLYSLRAVLSARFVLEHCQPAPVRFETLLGGSGIDPKLIAEIRTMVEGKASGSEGDGIERSEGIDRFVTTAMAQIAGAVEALPSGTHAAADLDRLFRAALVDGGV